MFGKVIPAILQDGDAFIVLETFAAGVILATGFIHVFPDACESLSWPCLTGKAWGSFPFAGFVSMLAAIMTLQICTLATSHYTRRHSEKLGQVEAGDNEGGEAASEAHVEHFHLQTHVGHGHGPALPATTASSSELLQHRVIWQVIINHIHHCGNMLFIN